MMLLPPSSLWRVCYRLNGHGPEARTHQCRIPAAAGRERRTKSRDRQAQVEARELRDDPPRAGQLYTRAVGGQSKSPCRTAIGRKSRTPALGQHRCVTAKGEARLSRFKNQSGKL